MAALNFFNTFGYDLGRAVHNFSTPHVLKAILTNTAPVATNAVRTDIAEIAAGGGYPGSGGLTLDGVTWSLNGSGGRLVITDEIMVASGAVPQWRYIVIYNDTPTSPADPLIGWFDYGAAVDMVSGDLLTIDFDGTNGAINVKF